MAWGDPPQSGFDREVAAFVAQSVAPCAAEWDRAETIPRGVVAAMAEAGLLALAVGTEHSGRGLDALAVGRAAAQIGSASASLLSMMTVHTMVCRAIGRWGRQELRRQWLPRLADGRVLAAFALSEPQIGSDAAAVQCRATRCRSGWRLDGCKTWISGACIADVALVVAAAEDGLGAFLVDLTRAGVEVRPIRGMLGFRGAMLGSITLDGVEVDDEAVLAKIGFGFTHVVGDALDLGRFCIAWGASGLLDAIVEAAVGYASRRKQFGALLIEHQLIQRMIADMVADRRAAWLLCEAAAAARLARSSDAIMAANTAKYFAARAAVRAASDAIQIHGAAGLGPDLPVQRYYRDAKAFELIEGSNEIQQMMIAQDARRLAMR